jgi:ketosteroid isomerase-like protein
MARARSKSASRSKPRPKPRAKARAARPRPKRAAAKKRAPKRALGADLAEVAAKIVDATLDESLFVIPELYAEDCVSEEPGGALVQGHDGIAQKLAGWNQMQQGTKWRPRNIAWGPGLVVVEWDCEVTLRDGRVARLQEVAVHEIEDGRIKRERFYYDPNALAPPQA